MDLKNRYQFQPWYVKLWRRRYYIPVPFKAFWAYINAGHDPYINNSYKFYYGIMKAMAQGNMKWYYTSDEVMGRLRAKL